MGIPMLRDTMEPVSPETFCKELKALRKGYEELRARSNLTRFCGRPIKKVYRDVFDDRRYYVFEYDNGTPLGQCIRIADFPGSLAADILRLRKSLPPLDGDHEIVKNEIIPLEYGIQPRLAVTETRCVPEDPTDVLSLLPVIHPVDLSIHTVKREVKRVEIIYHLRCQGGSCPGSPISPYIAQLLGRTREGYLVFEYLRADFFKPFTELRDIKRWLLHLISGLKALHSVGIIMRNLGHGSLFVRFPPTGPELIIGNLGSSSMNIEAPEFPNAGPIEEDFTDKSDIYDIGDVIKYWTYGVQAITGLDQGKVPAPLQTIVDACHQEVPELRPGLDSLKQMAENIKEEARGSEKFGGNE